MTELMKRYEAETGKSARDELYSGSIKLYMPANDYIAWLESQLRWRPVSEKPEKANMYFAKVRLYVGCEKLTTKIVYFDGERFLLTDVVKWLPIPPAPEGE